MSVEEFLGGVRVLQPSAENLRDPPLWIFLTPSLTIIFSEMVEADIIAANHGVTGNIIANNTDMNNTTCGEELTKEDWEMIDKYR